MLISLFALRYGGGKVEVGISFLKENNKMKIKWGLASSIRSANANFLLIVTENDILVSHPSKREYVVEELPSNTKLIVKRYTSNRGREYIWIFKPDGELVYRADALDADEIAKVLSQFIDKRMIREVLNYI